MKNSKKIICILFMFFLIITFSGCGSMEAKAFSNSVSEYRHNYFFGTNGNISASFTDGKRETEFRTDGVKTQLVDYGVIIVYANFVEEPKIELIIGEKTFNSKLEKNPFDGTFVCDILHSINDEDINSIELKIEGITKSIILENISKSFAINENKAFNIFVNKHRKVLKTFISNKEFMGEFFIKLVGDRRDGHKIYWYLLCVTRDGHLFSNIIDTMTGEILQS